MKNAMGAAILIASCLLSAKINAAVVYPVRPIEGYACGKLAMSAKEAEDFHFSVPIRVSPSPDAPVGTLAASVLLLKSPAHEVAGFVEVLQLNGKAGWIEKSRVRPFDGLCRPSLLSNGRIGFS